ncbi:hypothetical protein FVE85_8771 [Porphyridium purpureum]|uniref:Uncharacterized protein n=1 Tax=Porphyridium purpureum TaxID=35688 RepID=A0A5J4YPS4_PORPP|nr:hypothetical protein FVE85_8771 [Porphyridium purpureum]|eukprot:POR6292..scf296_7
MVAHPEKRSAVLRTQVDAPIVYVIIGEVMFDDEDDTVNDDYRVMLKTTKCFNLIVNLVYSGVSFRMGRRIMELIQEHSDIAYYGDCSDALLVSNIQISHAHAL